MTRPAQRILIAEDELKVARVLADYLRAAGYVAETVSWGPAVVPAVRRSHPDLLLLDLMLPGCGGLEVCRELRGFTDLPVVMLTALAEETDRLRGLEVGADDYVCKPFSPREVVARVKAVLRRRPGLAESTPVVVVGPLTIDEGQLRVSWRTHRVELTVSEYKILRALLRARGRVLTRARLLTEIHSSGGDTMERAVDTHIKNIRRKFCSVDADAQVVRSVYGEGYQLDVGV